MSWRWPVRTPHERRWGPPGHEGVTRHAPLVTRHPAPLKLAIVGRPNVGKSTLFNRITRTRDALVDDTPGVTRDRHYGHASWNEVGFRVVDTGGFAEDDDDRDLLELAVADPLAERLVALVEIAARDGEFLGTIGRGKLLQREPTHF